MTHHPERPSRTLRRAAMGLAGALVLSAVGPAVQAVAAPSKAPAVKEPDNAGSPRRLRLMTADQYINTLVYIFGPDLKLDTHFAPPPRTEGLLENGAASTSVNDTALETFQRTAQQVATKVTDAQHRNFLVPCKPADEKAPDTACATKFLAGVGRLLYRHKLSDEKVKSLVGEADEAAGKLKDFYAGLSSALEGMLISPEVLLVADTTEPDPAHPGRERLDAYSIASRLSFFLWNAAPDDNVLKSAESGEIMTAKGRAKLVDMMLASPRLDAGMRAFFDDMLGFDDFNTLAKDPMVYPSFTGVTAADAREQTLRTIIDQLLVKKKDYRDLFTTRDTWLSPALAAVYRLPSRGDWTPYTFPQDSLRAGLLTQISFLADHSHPGRSSPTLRGKALREILLCQPVPRPPPNVDFSLVENPPPNIKTQRDRLELHRKNPVCAGCHRITDPIGLALENFDGAGQFRDNERGSPIDTSGSLDGKTFKDPVGLGEALHDHPAVPQCLVKRAYAYGIGGPTTEADKAVLDYLDAKFADSGYRLPNLLRAITLSNAFVEVSDKPAPAPIKSASAKTP
jgi:hypothetical protein